MNFSWWTFALQVANFLILVWLLQRFLFKPVKAIVARRKEETDRVLDEASTEKKDAERLKQEIEAQRAQIEAERQKIIDETRAQLAAERQKAIEEARVEAEKIRTQTSKRLGEERTAASEELFERTIALAANLAERLLRETADSSMSEPLLARLTAYLDRMPSEERAGLFPQSGNHSLSVTVAHQLSAAEQTRWREQLVKRLGADLRIDFQNDPALIAGALITFPHAILSFNWRDALVTALKELRTNEHAG